MRDSNTDKRETESNVARNTANSGGQDSLISAALMEQLGVVLCFCRDMLFDYSVRALDGKELTLKESLLHVWQELQVIIQNNTDKMQSMYIIFIDMQYTVL